MMNLFFTPYLKSTRSTRLPLFEQAEKISFIHKKKYSINGYVFGNKINKKILMAHGWGSDCSFFSNYINELLAQGYCIFTFNCIAHGTSSGKKTSAVEYQHLLEEIDHTYGSFDIVMAHSLGSMAATHAFAKKNMIRFVLFSPAVSSLTQFNNFCTALKINTKLKEAFFKAAEKKYNITVASYNIENALLKVPETKALIIHDSLDMACPIIDTKQMLKNNFKNIIFLETKGLGHNKVARDPKVKQEVLDYIANN